MKKFISNMKHKLGVSVALLSLAMVSPFAFAGGGAAAPDLSEITELFPVYVGAVVAVLIAWAVALWSKRAAKLANPG